MAYPLRRRKAIKNMTNKQLLALIEKAAGDKEYLRTVIGSVEDLVFNLSLHIAINHLKYH